MKKPLLLTVFALTACGEPTSEELAARAARAAERERQTAAEQSSIRPKLISEQDGVRLYRTKDVERGQVVYFTTRGDTAWEYRSGKTTARAAVPGQP